MNNLFIIRIKFKLLAKIIVDNCYTTLPFPQLRNCAMMGDDFANHCQPTRPVAKIIARAARGG